MKNIWTGRHVAHDMSGFGHMSGFVKGVDYYCDRAILLPVDTVYVLKDESGKGLVEEHQAFLRRPEVALGPNNVVQVSGSDIFAGIMSDRLVLEKLQRATMNGSCMQIFCMTKRAEAFFAESLISKHCIDSAPLEIANKLNDKVELRRIGESMGLSHAFLDYVVADEIEKTKSAVKTFLARPQEEVPFAVVKQVDRAGGDGFLRIMRGDDLDELLLPYFERYGNKRVLIEEGHPHKALSMQVAVGQPRSFQVVGWTRQLVEAERGRHFGNSMVRMATGHEHPLIDKEHRHSMKVWSLLHSERAHAYPVRYRGILGYDYMLLKRPRKDGRDLFLLECNARQTASTYPLAVSHQMEGRGKDEWGITMWNAVSTAAQSVGEVLAKLGDDLVFSGTRGIIPFNPRLMALPEEHATKVERITQEIESDSRERRLLELGEAPGRQVGIIAVGNDLVEAGRMGREAKARLIK